LLHRYESQAHSSQGYFFLFVAAALSALDLIALGGRLVSYVRTVRAGEEKFSFKSCWNVVVLDRDDSVRGVGAEYTGLVSEESDELDAAELKSREIEADDVTEPIHVRRAQFVQPIDTVASSRTSSEEAGQWANEVSRPMLYPHSAASERTVFEHSSRSSIHSDETLHEHVYIGLKTAKKRGLLKKIGRVAFDTAERCLIFAGYMQTITGIVVYTGGCRESYINGCLAHLISKQGFKPVAFAY
jgi:hypothetical protein